MNRESQINRVWVRSVLEEWGQYCCDNRGDYRGGKSLQSNFPRLESPGYECDVWTDLDERMRKVTIAVGSLDGHMKETIKQRYRYRCDMSEVARRLRVTTRTAERYEAASCDALSVILVDNA